VVKAAIALVARAAICAGVRFVIDMTLSLLHANQPPPFAFL
jgi:hypothetical protein